MSDDINNIPSEKMRPPKIGDQLFVEGDDWSMNAYLDLYRDPTEAYIAGYKEAGDSLVKLATDRNGTADTLVYPIVFLYRHYIELRLKALLHDGCRLLECEYKPIFAHLLSDLWTKVRAILVELWPDENQANLEAMDSLIAQYDQLDPRSTTFRYPMDFKGNHSIKLQSPRVDLKHLKDVVEAMSIILEGASGAIYMYQGHINDIQSEGL